MVPKLLIVESKDCLGIIKALLLFTKFAVYEFLLRFGSLFYGGLIGISDNFYILKNDRFRFWDILFGYYEIFLNGANFCLYTIACSELFAFLL